ncbi:CynX/NimT family MFS transporter [Mycetocola zhujimingii]|uniref:MFS transporter n=1 Tax=Mycetocola zhujimingii TaxID=2079792 RepID=UPI000D34DBCE|nr:MFS transporter [Mycetocola zhujimingii]AWB87652.1 MFS transporter [Mycetocola zhujimingii]
MDPDGSRGDANRTALLAFVGVVFFALTLRTAVAATAPVLDRISEDLHLSAADYSVLSTIPPLCFAFGGLITSRITRYFGLRGTALGCLAIMLIGHTTRSLAPDFAVFLTASIAIFIGMGVGNVILPPIVKRYFPLRIAQISTVYITVLAVSTFVPPLAAVPLADLGSWRWSLAAWAILNAVAVIPWIALALSGGRRPLRLRTGAVSAPTRAQRAAGWALAAAFGVSTLNAYALFGWLPAILIDTAGFSEADAGAALALYAALALPFALLVPGLTMKMRRPALIAAIAGVSLVIGNTMLAISPTTGTMIWVIIAGLGPVLFPLCITLVMRLSRDEGEASRLGGFAQAIGYAVGALGPSVVGIGFTATGGWTFSLLFLASTGVVAIAAALVLDRVVPRAVTES